jgi:hypothetical protein
MQVVSLVSSRLCTYGCRGESISRSPSENSITVACVTDAARICSGHSIYMRVFSVIFESADAKTALQKLSADVTKVALTYVIKPNERHFHPSLTICPSAPSLIIMSVCMAWGLCRDVDVDFI